MTKGYDEQTERIREEYDYIMKQHEEDGTFPTFDEWEDIFEDRDPFEFI
jgi:hypothetical protein